MIKRYATIKITNALSNKTHWETQDKFANSRRNTIIATFDNRDEAREFTAKLNEEFDAQREAERARLSFV